MAYSRLVTPADGVTTVYAVNFPLGYLSIADVKGYVTGEVSETGEQLYRTLTWLTTGTVDIGLPGAVGSDVVIERTVDKTDLVHNFVDGDILTEQSMDESFMQSMMAVHEVLDGRFSALGAHLDMNGFRVQNLGDPVNDGDAVPMSWFLENSGAINLEAAQAAQAAAEAAASQSAGHSASAATAQSGSEAARDEAVAAKEAVEEALQSLPQATTEIAGISLRATAEDIAAKTATNKTVSPADLAGLDGIPVGALLDLYGDDSEAPPGYLLCNGAAVTATYPELRAFGLARGWQVNASGDPLLPDSGGYFRRGWRTGQVVDSGRVLGTVQGDAIRNITGRFGGLVGDPVGVGAFKTAEHYTGSGGYSNTNYSITFDVSNVVPTAADNHPYNYTCTTWIKAYPAATSPGSVDLANLVNDIQGVSVRTAALEEAKSTETSVELTGLYQVLYTGIPAAANKLHIRLSSTNVGTAVDVLLRLITASGEVASGYVGGVSTIDSPVTVSAYSVSFVLVRPVVSVRSGLITLARKPGTNIWTLSGSGGFAGGACWQTGGACDAGATVTGVRLFVGSSGSFSSGSVGFWWEK